MGELGRVNVVGVAHKPGRKTSNLTSIKRANLNVKFVVGDVRLKHRLGTAYVETT